MYACADLIGIFRAFDEPHGSLNLPAYVKGYPNSAIVLGLWLKNTYEPLARGDCATIRKVDRLIQHLKSLERPIYLRIGYEVDRYWSKRSYQ